MKQFKRILPIILLVSQSIFSQGFLHDDFGPFPGGKIAELEKIKLIETLNLDEETTLKFFSRRNLHQNQMKIIMREKDSLLTQLSSLIKSESKADYESMIGEIFKIENKLIIERQNFIKSLHDIFSSEQVAMLLVFERRFRSEIRKELLKQGKRMRGRNPALD